MDPHIVSLMDALKYEVNAQLEILNEEGEEAGPE
jgi:hypothetical protein